MACIKAWLCFRYRLSDWQKNIGVKAVLSHVKGLRLCHITVAKEAFETAAKEMLKYNSHHSFVYYLERYSLHPYLPNSQLPLNDSEIHLGTIHMLIVCIFQ